MQHACMYVGYTGEVTVSLWSPTNVEHPCTNFRPFFLMQLQYGISSLATMNLL